jgi:hypothetical protein
LRSTWSTPKVCNDQFFSCPGHYPSMRRIISPLSWKLAVWCGRFPRAASSGSLDSVPSGRWTMIWTCEHETWMIKSKLPSFHQIIDHSFSFQVQRKNSKNAVELISRLRRRLNKIPLHCKAWPTLSSNLYAEKTDEKCGMPRIEPIN